MKVGYHPRMSIFLKYWWSLPYINQRLGIHLSNITLILVFGGIIFLYSLDIKLWLVGCSISVLSTLLALNYWSIDLSKTVYLKHTGVFSNKYVELHFVKQEIENLLECMRNDYWVKLCNNDFPDYSSIWKIVGYRGVSVTEQFEDFTLTQKMLSYEDYHRCASLKNKPNAFPPTLSALDAEVKVFFVESIVTYFNVLPTHLRNIYLEELYKSDIQLGLRDDLSYYYY